VLTLTTAALAVVSCLPIVTRLGGEFLPRVDEGALLFMPTTLPGVPEEQLAMQLRWQDRTIGRFKEVATVFGKVGRAETATDPAPYSMAETTIVLLPRSDWPKIERTRWYSSWAPPFLKSALRLLRPAAAVAPTTELAARLDHAPRMPGWTSAWTAPARARMDMMSTGIRTPIGVRIVSPDPARLDALGATVRAVVGRVAGTRSAVFESLGGEPSLKFETDASALALHKVDRAAVESTADLLIKGGQMGEILLDGRPARVRIAPDVSETARGRADQLRSITVRADNGAGLPVSLALLGRPAIATQPATLRTERGELVSYVYVGLADGENLLDYVERGRNEVDRAVRDKELALLPGERIEWAGQYDLLASGQRRLMWIIPMVAVSMLALLYLQFRSVTEALIV